MLSSTPAAWEKAQQLKAAGPFNPHSPAPGQLQLLQDAWALLYPRAEPLCSVCPGVLMNAYQQILREYRYFSEHNQTTPVPAGDMQAQPQTISTTTMDKAADNTSEETQPRYSFRPGVTEVREFGNPIPHTTLTDKLASRLIKEDADYARLFVDREQVEKEAAQAADATPEPDEDNQDTTPADTTQKLPSPSAVKAMKKEELAAQYKLELGQDVPAELATNADVAQAIINHRESQAE